ncbi:MAG TPA: amidase [Nitrososphaerales archaeon]|nr:amidase [Nitrososphaerales archaeon]
MWRSRSPTPHFTGGTRLAAPTEPELPRFRSPLTIKALSDAYRQGALSPVTVTKTCLDRIEGLGRSLNCFITVLGESALKAAEESERRYKAGTPLSLLDGIPIAVKDVFYIAGVRCTAGSKILEDNIAGYDSTAVRCLKEKGAVLVGTTNLHEFAAGVTSDNPHFGPVRNPWDKELVAGGSSGGSAVAVAAGMAAGAIGTDTAGSVRIPAALCGIVGFKPTYGMVSRIGVVPLAASLDTVGVLAQSAWDAAVLLHAMAGHDKSDVTTVDEPVPNYPESLSAPFQGARIGVVRAYFHDDVDSRVEQNFDGFTSKLHEIGCTIGEADLGSVHEVYEKWLIIRRAEATAFHQRWLDTTPELYGEDVRRLLELGEDIRAVDYINAINSRPAIIERFSRAMDKFDFLIAPTTSIPAPKIRQPATTINGKEVSVYSALNRLTLPFNYVGFPVVSIPSGLVDGLPLGVQVIGKLFEEAALLRLAHAYEQRYGPFPLPPSQ